MQLPQNFVPTSREVGAVAMLVEFFLSGAVLAFLGAFVFFLSTRCSVAPRHRAGAVLMAAIALVAAVSYWTIQSYYHDVLHQLAATADLAARRKLVHDAYLAIGQYRYMDWAVTLPLLLLKVALILRVKPREMAWPIVGLLAAGFWMVLAGFIGEQQLAPDGSVIVKGRIVWGFLAALGFGAIPGILFLGLGRRFGCTREDDDGRAFRLMVWSLLGVWAIYPLGYLLPAIPPSVLPNANFNWLHIAFTLADLVSKIGVGVAAYLIGAAELERRVPHEAVQSARMAA